MSVVTGLQLPFGIQPVNPVPVDSWSGPFTGSIDTVQSAVDAANSGIPSAIRFQSMEVRLIVSGTSRKFWYRDGIDDVDLVEFASGAGGGGGSSVAGSNTQVQFNDGGVFGATSDFTFDVSTNTLTVPSLSGSLTALSVGTPYLISGDNISITTGSNGQITISSTAVSTSINTQMSWMELPTGEADGLNMFFTLAYAPSPSNSLMFYVNGVLQKQGTGYDYTISGNSVVMLNAPGVGSNISATYSYQTAPPAGSNTAWMETPDGEIDGMNIVYTLQNTPYPLSALMFFVNGVLQVQGNNYDFLSSDNVVILRTAPEAGSNLTATYPY